MTFDIKVHADWRAPTCAVLIGSGIGLALGAAYMAGGMSRAATDHARASRLAGAAAGAYSDTVLEREAAALDPGVLRVARRHDPFVSSGSVDRDRQDAVLLTRLENTQQPSGSRIPLRGVSLPAAAPFHLSGALETSRELECLTQAVYFEARGETPAHLHWDVRYAFRAAGSEAYRVSAESHDLAWIEIGALRSVTREESMLRMARKWQDGPGLAAET